MAKRLATALCAGLLATGHGVSYAQSGATAQDDKRTAVDAETAGERWSIRAFLARRKERAYVRRSSTPNASLRQSYWRNTDTLHYNDHSSPINRVRALSNWRLATLWRGQRSTLVLGLVGNGYFGVRLDAAEPKGDSEPAATD